MINGIDQIKTLELKVKLLTDRIGQITSQFENERAEHIALLIQIEQKDKTEADKAAEPKQGV